MQVLVVNVGSNSLKLRVLGDDDEIRATCDIDPWHPDDPDRALQEFLEAAEDVDAVGHRVVHGGEELRDATIIDDRVVATVTGLSSLAPLHQPRTLAALQTARSVLRDIPHVACFDTAFHATLPPAAATYALPASWRERWPLRRFGFHGLSHGWAVRRAPTLAHRPPGSPPVRRIISCHLGGGGSLCAALEGRSVDTTMGFTPLEGLVMVTRSGSIDPGLVLWLITQAGLSPEAVTEGLEHESGLRGLTGTSGDMRDVLAARAEGDPAADAGYDVYVHQLRRWIGAMAAALDGVDLLVFTGGLAEHVEAVRADTVAGLGFLGLRVDPLLNTGANGDTDISPAGPANRVVVVTSREDREIGAQVRQLLGGAQAASVVRG